MLWILILRTLSTPQTDLLNENDALNIAFALSIKIIFTSLTTALSLCLNMIYKRPILTAIHYINLLVTVFNFHLIPVPHSVSTTYKDKAITDIL